MVAGRELCSFVLEVRSVCVMVLIAENVGRWWEGVGYYCVAGIL